jgi:hypothetical protein
MASGSASALRSPFVFHRLVLIEVFRAFAIDFGLSRALGAGLPYGTQREVSILLPSTTVTVRGRASEGQRIHGARI